MPDNPLPEIGALPEMEPSAYERAVNIVKQQHVLGLTRSIQISLSAAYRDGQFSILAAIGPLIEAARGVKAANDRFFRAEGQAAEDRTYRELDGAISQLTEALSAFPAASGSGWRPIDDTAKTGDEVILGRHADTFVVLASWDEDEQGHPGFPWVAPEGCRYPLKAFDMYTPVPAFPAPPSPTSETSDE